MKLPSTSEREPGSVVPPPSEYTHTQSSTALQAQLAAREAEFAQKVTKVPGQLGELYKGIPHHVMHALGFTITNVTERRAPALSDQPVWCRILAEGEAEHMMWTVDGRPPSKIRVDRADGVHTSAACMVNRVPDVIAAPSGVRLISQLGPLRPSLT